MKRNRKKRNPSWEELPLDINEEKITEYLTEIFKQKGSLIFTDWDQPIGQLYPGSGAYRLPGGGLTGIGGWEHFTKLLKETNAN